MSVTSDVLTSIKGIFETPASPPPLLTTPPSPVFSATASEIEPGVAQLTLVSSLLRADGRLGATHLDVRLSRSDAAEIAFVLRRSANQLEDFAAGREIAYPRTFGQAR
jgi:hypothetical protein